MTDPVAYRPKPGEIPATPGVYRFRDEARRILYVGKAKNLRARLANYFQPLQNLHERTRTMVTSAASVEWTIVRNEFEALQLEYTWIQEFSPPYNVQFKDDKSYPYLAMTMGDEVPRVFITRNHNIPGARYFGPYTKVWAIRESLDLLLKVFPMRSSSDAVFNRARRTGRPCLLAEIGKCSAPCVGRISVADHRKIAEDLASFLEGNDTGKIRELTESMKKASAEQDFEAAAKYRDEIRALEAVLAKNAIVFSDRVDADVFGIADDELTAAVQQFAVRGGRIRAARGRVVDKELDVALPDLVESVLHRSYQDEEPPREILVPVLPENSADLERWLTERRSLGRVRLRVPMRGEKATLAQTALVNAKNSLALYKTRRSADFVARSQALGDLQEALGLATAPLRMECYDISHLGGTGVVASMVVFEDGLPRKDQYRKFSIAQTSDDTDSMRQVLERRLAYLAVPAGTGAAEGEEAGPVVAPTLAEEGRRRKFASPPDLVIVDGGLPQVHAAQRVLDAADLPEKVRRRITLVGIAKRLEELWLPGEDFPVILPRSSDALFMIQHIRDEAHRFAITYQRASRRKNIHTTLAGIPGLGPARVKALLKHFGSVRMLRQASLDEMTQVPGIGPQLARAIHRALPDR
ncbi:MAG TPA: excinuclease ABC subunit UvrC [Microbacteriaceae bacterium]|nr:excinuclease ABC subunit UvrC [Microbacteriaceae bacterium]